MIELNNIYTADIIDTTVMGAGIAKIENSAVFVPGSVEGDTAEIKIISKGKNYCTGHILKLLKRSSYREESKCGICSKCGGCTLSMINYEYENEIKKRSVKKAFRQFGLDTDLVSDTVYYPVRINYRNKCTLHFDFSSSALGYYENSSRTVVPVSSCNICSEPINSVIGVLSSGVDKIASEKLKDIVLQSSYNGDVTVTVKSEDDNDITVIFDYIHEFYEKTINGNNSTHTISSKVCNLDLKYSSGAFRQVNEDCFSLLLDTLLKLILPLHPENIIDLYCGSGIIGLFLAKNIPDSKVFGVEINKDSIADAKVNAALNVIDNISFRCGNAAEFKNHMPENFMPSVIVVDPPRNGLNKETIKEILSLNPDNLLYVSCNPFTLSRDISNLTGLYSIEKVIPFNMFPFTEHVESVVLMSRA